MKRANRLLLPAVQFTDDGEVPGLGAVLQALRKDHARHGVWYGAIDVSGALAEAFQITRV